MRNRLVVLLVTLVAVVAVVAGVVWVEWNKGGTGAGLYSRHWQPDPVQGYWNPDKFYQPTQLIKGRFEPEMCVQCHQGVTPGIVADWRASRHAQGSKKVWCSDCHGQDHQQLRLPTPDVCGGCHQQQHGEFKDEARFGFPSHVLAMERAQDAPHFADKPKAEVQSCVQCHSVATKCDSCHTRHKFEAAEARRPEACITCHSGPPHPDDETYLASAHGRIYTAEGKDWDWTKPLLKGNYKAPTCAYCHMQGGKHQVADKALWKFGIREINPDSSQSKVLREQWVDLCADCHDKGQASTWLKGLDAERKASWHKLYQAESILKGLRKDHLLQPDAGERPGYPLDWIDLLFPSARIGFFEGQASAFYNVSAIERSYFEMWYFANLESYKGAAHGDQQRVDKGHTKMGISLESIKQQAKALREGRQVEKHLWNEGAYTAHNRENN